MMVKILEPLVEEPYRISLSEQEELVGYQKEQLKTDNENNGCFSFSGCYSVSGCISCYTVE